MTGEEGVQPGQYSCAYGNTGTVHAFILPFLLQPEQSCQSQGERKHLSHSYARLLLLKLVVFWEIYNWARDYCRLPK